MKNIPSLKPTAKNESNTQNSSQREVIQAANAPFNSFKTDDLEERPSKPAILVLADGSVFEGLSIGADGFGVGELVFNTSMTGYQEMLTDPSYAEQIITLTTAHVGNTGCNDEDMESNRVWARGLVVRDCSIIFSNYRATKSLPDWLKQHNVFAITGIDTRALTQRLRDFGACGACVSTHVTERDKALSLAQSFKGLSNVDLAKVVTRQSIETWHKGVGEWQSLKSKTKDTLDDSNNSRLQYHVVVYDFGVKHTILRMLYDLGCRITIVPAKTSAQDVLNLKPDGVFLSNGPGDPKACEYAIDATKTLLESNTPLFGICLGFQILALASGAQSLKMKFGHHGANHPVISVNNDKRVYITSQNHGFSIDEASLPDCLMVTHRSLFDRSLQGIMRKDKPALGFQGHPEASPGPHDIGILFNQFINLMTEYRCCE